MTIEFRHLTHIVQGFLLYNLKEVEDAFLVNPQRFKEELGAEIFVCRIKNAWQTDSPIRKDFPETFVNIILVYEQLSKQNSNSHIEFLKPKFEIKEIEQRTHSKVSQR
jgi:hypothetical protein